MCTLLARIQIHPGMETDFEELMAYMYRETHEKEEGVLRYEYWRGQKTGFYYCLLSFRDTLTFWRHQASDHHEDQGHHFQEYIADLELETLDPVQQASPLPATEEQSVDEDEPELLKTQAATFPIETLDWWLSMRDRAAGA